MPPPATISLTTSNKYTIFPENSNRSTPVVSAPRREELFPGAGVGAGAMPREPDGVQEVSALHMSSTHNEGEGSVVGPAQRRLHFDSHVTLDRRQMASSPFSPFSPATNGWSMLFPRSLLFSLLSHLLIFFRAVHAPTTTL